MGIQFLPVWGASAALLAREGIAMSWKSYLSVYADSLLQGRSGINRRDVDRYHPQAPVRVKFQEIRVAKLCSRSADCPWEQSICAADSTY